MASLPDADFTTGLTADACWQLVAARRPGDRPFVYAVTTTGIYCRPGCSSRLPKRQNVRFFATATAAASAGFRACKRCQPDSETALDALLRRATAVIDAAEQAPSVDELATALETSMKTLSRAFRQRLGLTPKAFIQARRRERLKTALAEEERVTDAIYAAGYGASSRFYSEAEAVLGMTPGSYRAKGAGLELSYAIADCPLGRMLVAATEKGVAMIAFGDDDRDLEADLALRFAAAERRPDALELAPYLRQVVAAIEEPEAAAAIPLDIRGTAFQQRVWAALRAIPLGQTRSYGEVAAAIGKPGAVRAVANACASNPVAVAVPCHRVLPKDGDAAGAVGGYRWGPARKSWLLERERRRAN